MEAVPRLGRLERVGAGYQAEVFVWDEGRVLRLAYREITSRESLWIICGRKVSSLIG